MADKELTFSDFVTDKDGNYSKAKFMALANQLIGEGRDPSRVFLAMYRAALAGTCEHSIGEHLGWVRTVAKDSAEYLADLEIEADRILARQ